MENVKVSIIIPVYNAEKYIAKCLDSLINQTLKEIEIIIVNDKTPDNSMEICKKYAERDKRIKIYNKEKNEGHGLTRNYAIKKAKADIIGFVDADDYVDLDYFEKMYNKITETNTDICFAEYLQIRNQEEKEYKKYKIPFEDEIEPAKNVLSYIFQNITNSNKCSICTAVWQAVYRKSVIEENNLLFVSRKYFAEDTIFFFDYLMNCKSVSFARNTYYYYFYNEQSIMHAYVEGKFEKVKLLKDKLIEQATKYGVLDEYYGDIIVIFMGGVRITIRQEINHKDTIKNKINNIKKIVNDEEVKKSLKNKKKESFKKEVFNFLIKTKQVRLLIFIYKIMHIN